MLAPLLAAAAITAQQTDTSASVDAAEQQDVRCFQALGYRFGAEPDVRPETGAQLRFYVGRMSARGEGWRMEVFRPTSPELTKETYAPVAEACRKRALEILGAAAPTP